MNIKKNLKIFKAVEKLKIQLLKKINIFIIYRSPKNNTNLASHKDDTLKSIKFNARK